MTTIGLTMLISLREIRIYDSASAQAALDEGLGYATLSSVLEGK